MVLGRKVKIMKKYHVRRSKKQGDPKCVNSKS